MKRRLVFVVIVLSALLLPITMAGCASLAAPAPVVLGGEWMAEFQAKVEQPVRMAAFLDEQVGFTGGPGSEGTAQYTTDGGQSWTISEAGGS